MVKKFLKQNNIICDGCGRVITNGDCVKYEGHNFHGNGENGKPRDSCLAKYDFHKDLFKEPACTGSYRR